MADERPRLEPLPTVRLVSVDDVRLPSPPGLRQDLMTFYTTVVGLLAEPELVFRAENFRLRFDEVDQVPVERETVKPLGIQVPSLIAVERRLADAEIEYIRETALQLGRRIILAQDPAGNWLELFEARVIG